MSASKSIEECEPRVIPLNEWTISVNARTIIMSRPAEESLNVQRAQRFVLDVDTGAMALHELYERPTTRWQIERVDDGDDDLTSYPKWDHATDHHLYESLWSALGFAMTKAALGREKQT